MIYGLIGERLGHSFSAEIHARLGEEPYELKELPPDRVEAFLKKGDFRGINVTIPYKQAVIPFLDEISGTARAIGAVNTIVRRNGKLYGDNTDATGLTMMLRRTGAELRGKKVLIAGTGGTSRTAKYAAEQLGAAEVIRISRSAREGAPTYEEAARKHRDAQILINTTPCGMYPQTGENRGTAGKHHVDEPVRRILPEREKGGGIVPGHGIPGGYRGEDFPGAAGGKGEHCADWHAGKRKIDGFRCTAGAHRPAGGRYGRPD